MMVKCDSLGERRSARSAEPVDVGHHEIEQDDVRLKPLRNAHGITAAGMIMQPC
jgi:hypothetical protein